MVTNPAINTDETSKTTADSVQLESLITPNDVYTVQMQTPADLMTVYIVAIGGVLVAGIVVHMIMKRLRKGRNQ